MLVVVSIMMILVAVSASAFRPANDSRRIREAARLMNIYLGSARNRAMETGRPCGVVLHPFNSATYALSMDQCETPPAYAGETLDAVVKVQDWTYLPGTTNYYAANQATVLKVIVRPGDIPDTLIHRGDLIQLNNQGPLYTVDIDSGEDSFMSRDYDFPLLGAAPDPNAIDFTGATALPATDGTTPADGFVDNYMLTLTLSPLCAQQTPWPRRPNSNPTTILAPTNWSQPVSFRILRSPVAGSSLIKGGARTLQLPKATVVDLGYSGYGSGIFVADWTAGTTYYVGNTVLLGNSYYTCVQTHVADAATNKPANTTYWKQIAFPDITIMFAPNGAVASIYTGGEATPITDPIYLLVGKRERMLNLFALGNTNEDTMVNIQDQTNLWVVINPQTGLVTTGEVGAPTGSETNEAGILVSSRALARDSQGMGGK